MEELLKQQGEAMKQMIEEAMKQQPEAMKQYMIENVQKDIDELEVNVSVRALSFPNLGVSSSAYRMLVQSRLGTDPAETILDFLLIQEGRMIGGFGYSLTYPAYDKPDGDEEQELARVLVAKLKKAEAALPD